MAAGTLPKPGTKYGPCLTRCEHLDCARTRTELASLCPLCHQPIADKPYYRMDAAGKVLSHALCVETAAAEER